VPDDHVALKLTPENVGKAAIRTNTYESFGRALAAHVLQTAAQSKLGTDVATVPLEFTLRPSLTAGRDPAISTVCIDMCVGPICIHVFVE
jgi:hypothetical protein